MLNETVRSRWFSACVNAGLWLLLVLIVAGIGGRTPRFREAEADMSAVSAHIPVTKLAPLFTVASLPKTLVDAANPNPFATTHFMPPTPPPPPPPTTCKYELTYQGFYRAADGPVRALIRLGDSLVAVPVGAAVTTNLYVIAATFQTLTVTNSAAQTNVLTINTKKEVEVPIK